MRVSLFENVNFKSYQIYSRGKGSSKNDVTQFSIIFFTLRLHIITIFITKASILLSQIPIYPSPLGREVIYLQPLNITSSKVDNHWPKCEWDDGSHDNIFKEKRTRDA